MRLSSDLIKLAFTLILSSNTDNDGVVVTGVEYVSDYEFRFRLGIGDWLTVNMKKAIDNSRVNGTYFTTIERAIDYALDTANIRGFDTPIPPQIGFDQLKLWVGGTTTITVPLYKNGLIQRKFLHIVLYRMESGKYELTHYIN